MVDAVLPDDWGEEEIDRIAESAIEYAKSLPPLSEWSESFPREFNTGEHYTRFDFTFGDVVLDGVYTAAELRKIADHVESRPEESEKKRSSRTP